MPTLSFLLRLKRISLALLFYFLVQFDPLIAYALDNDKEDRARVVAPRNDRFYRPGTVRNYVNLGGEYESDEDSRQRILLLGHFYRSSKLINEIDFLRQTDSSETIKNNWTTKSKLYDFQLSTKAVLFDTANYAVLYHRTRYDSKSTYYYDMMSAVGIGRMFFNDLLELDLAVGYSDVKNYGNRFSFIPSLRAEFELNRKLRFIARGYMYLSELADDYQIRIRLQYMLDRKVYLQLTHDYDKRTYQDKKHRPINENHRRITLGIRYDI